MNRKKKSILAKRKTVTFEQNYWDSLYDQPETMDGIGNVDDHIQYIKSVFELEKIPITSIIEFGFGMGVMLKNLIQTYKPYKVVGIEPSKYIYKKVKKEDFKINQSMKLSLFNSTIEDFVEKEREKKNIKAFDLGVCMSVMQYLDEIELNSFISYLSQKCLYLYLTVPTDKELKWQEESLDFHDQYALKRSRRFYQKILKQHFTFISSKVLESKFHFKEEESSFSDLLYRF